MDVINHIEIGVADVDASRRFYEAVLAPLGLSLVISVDPALTILGTARYGFGRDGYPSFWIHGETGAGRSIHISFTAISYDRVDSFHAVALANGGSDNGSPGIRTRYHPRYYAAFVLDPDGNNIEAVCQSE
ncbi:VOC family protein [Gluconobacter cerinus]|nr:MULTISPECIES: VOC family protein [unclassified Gluconobacter]MBS1020249.1 VOC family protein [Gluconobacter cerinus]MBS1032955.1 VOC family protein [Gluconobacter cerinus]MBS1069989.1 VOC family protein [Gluconobacter cerinus]